MKTLITGGMGFIGSSIATRLLRDDTATVTILDNLSEKIHGTNAVPRDFKDPRVTFMRGDVSCRTDVEAALAGCDTVIHLAAETGTGQSMYDIEHYARVNVMGTALLLDVLGHAKHAVKKIIVASSRAIYGEGRYECSAHGIVYPNARTAADMSRGDFDVKCPHCAAAATSLLTDEDSKIHPLSFYGITKQTQEQMIMTLCPPLGIAPVAFRYQNVYGPGQSLSNPYTGILSIFSNRLRMNKQIQIFEDGKESRDFVYIDDVVEATVSALHNEKANGQIFNVGSGTAVTVLAVAGRLKEMYGSQSEIVVNGKYRAGDIRHNTADISRIKTMLGFQPRTAIDDGLKAFTSWVLEQPVSPDRYEASLEEMKDKGLYK